MPDRDVHRPTIAASAAWLWPCTTRRPIPSATLRIVRTLSDAAEIRPDVFTGNLIRYDPTGMYEGSSRQAIDAFRAVLEEHGIHALAATA